MICILGTVMQLSSTNLNLIFPDHVRVGNLRGFLYVVMQRVLRSSRRIYASRTLLRWYREAPWREVFRGCCCTNVWTLSRPTVKAVDNKQWFYIWKRSKWILQRNLSWAQCSPLASRSSADMVIVLFDSSFYLLTNLFFSHAFIFTGSLISYNDIGKITSEGQNKMPWQPWYICCTSITETVSKVPVEHLAPARYALLGKSCENTFSPPLF